MCDTTGLDPWEATTVHMESWLRTMPPKSARSYAQALRSFHLWCFAHGFTESNHAADLRNVRVGRPEPGTFATPDEMRRLYQAAIDLPPDHKCLVLLLLLTGSRLREVLDIDVADVERRGDRVLCRLHRKGGHTDVVALPQAAGDAVLELLVKRSTGALIRSNGKRMRPELARRIVTRLAEQCGCEQRITPHSLRRSFVTFARQLEIADADIIAMTGHKDREMIDYYDRRFREARGDAGNQIEQELRKQL
ncbi:tyrosine-type recombinase/integrase [Corynebacterium hindlerae]|uniref:Tyrosine-type recombinase/integrase n=1 Tax=Corynebacterium hindlerae TaxID=699041 RepID=A0A7G5FBT8_9CORY|nr:tyrosine-type recombinase/integrase [Corynebacterium hindlerae]QMV84079.1 tyrosine-type recombinase/integrase [Corynebacterium hindlerae]